MKRPYRMVREGYICTLLEHEAEGGFVVSLTGKPAHKKQLRTRVTVTFLPAKKARKPRRMDKLAGVEGVIVDPDPVSRSRKAKALKAKIRRGLYAADGKIDGILDEILRDAV